MSAPDSAVPTAIGERTPWLPLTLLVILAIGTRVIGLNSGMWIDEIYSLVLSFRQPAIEIASRYWGDNHHPLYALLAHASIAAFGEHPWTARLPAMCFGVASVPALYLLGTLVTARLEALLAAALLAVSYHHVWFSQNARGYTALAFFTLVCTWALLRGLRSNRVRYSVFYGVSAALGIYTHLTMAFTVFAHVVICVADALRARPRRWAEYRAAISGFAIAGGLALLLYAPMLSQVVSFFLDRPSPLRGVSTPGWALGEALRVLQLGSSGGIAVVGVMVVGLGVLATLAGTLSYARQDRTFILAFILPPAVTVGGALVARGTMYPRFFFFLIGIGLLIVVRGVFVIVHAVAHWLRPAQAVSSGTALPIGIVGAMLVVSTVSLWWNYRYPKQDFEGAMKFVVDNKAAGDQVVSTGVPSDPYTTLYSQSWPNVANLIDLSRVRARGGRTWVLYTFPRYLEQSAPDVAGLLRRECKVARIFPGTVGGGDIVVCTLDPAS